MGKERLRKYRQWKRAREAARLAARVANPASISDAPLPPVDLGPARLLHSLRLAGLRLRPL